MRSLSIAAFTYCYFSIALQYLDISLIFPEIFKEGFKSGDVTDVVEYCIKQNWDVNTQDQKGKVLVAVFCIY